MAGIIIYKGKYGATEQYSTWIAEELNLPVYRASAENSDILNYCSYVILGTSVYVGKFQLTEWIRQHQDILQRKKIFLLVVSGTSPNEKDKLNALVQKNIPAALLKNIEVFFLRGRMIRSNLSFFDSFILKMGASMVKDPVEKKKMLTDFDCVKKENLKALLSTIKASGFIARFTQQVTE